MTMCKKKAAKKDRVLDLAQLKAAKLLAYMHYSKGQNRQTGGVAAAAKEAGVSEKTIYEWLKYDEFVAEIEANKAMFTVKATAALEKAWKAGNPTAAIFWLKLHDMERFDDQYRRDLALLEKRAEIAQREIQAAVASLPGLVIQTATAAPNISSDLKAKLDEVLH